MANIFNEDFRNFNDALNKFGILKKVKGCDFEEAYKISKMYDESGLQVRFVHINTLIEAKKVSGRYIDLDDIEKLTL